MEQMVTLEQLQVFKNLPVQEKIKGGEAVKQDVLDKVFVKLYEK